MCVVIYKTDLPSTFEKFKNLVVSPAYFFYLLPTYKTKLAPSAPPNFGSHFCAYPQLWNKI